METPCTQTSDPPVRAPLQPAAACPRCHAGLSAVCHPVRREGRMTALLCPSVTCGYKLIVVS
jgi:hypothetical protein